MHGASSLANGSSFTVTETLATAKYVENAALELMALFTPPSPDTHTAGATSSTDHYKYNFPGNSIILIGT